MFFTPRPVPKRVSGGVVCLMLVMLGVALFAGFDLMGTLESSGPPATPVVTGTAAAPRAGSADAFLTIGQAAIQAVTAVITRVVTEWWPTALMLDWMQAVRRVWTPIHRLAGTSPPQP